MITRNRLLEIRQNINDRSMGIPLRNTVTREEDLEIREHWLRLPPNYSYMDAINWMIQLTGVAHGNR